MSKYLGMGKISIRRNEKLFANMVGDIKGALYYNITAWQQLIYQLPVGKKTSSHIAKLLGMENAEFDIPEGKTTLFDYIKLFVKVIWAFATMGSLRKKYVDNCESALNTFGDEDLKSKTHQELVELYHKYEQNLGENWLAPVLNGFYAMILFTLLKKIVRNSRLQSNYPNFVNDILYAQGDIISVQIVREFQAIVLELQQNEALKTLILSKKEQLSNKEIGVLLNISESTVEKQLSSALKYVKQQLLLHYDKISIILFISMF